MSSAELQTPGLGMRMWQFALPSLVVALVAGVVAGLVEGVVFAHDALAVAAAAGFSAVYAVPLMWLPLVAARLVWRAWLPVQLVAATRDEGGGTPAIAGWVLYAGVCLGVLAFVSSTAVVLGARSFTRSTINGLATSMVVAATAGLLMAVARPAVRGVTALLRRLDRRLRGAGRSLFTPRRILLMAAAISGVALLAVWRLSVVAEVGHLALDAGVYPAALVVGGVMAQLAWQRLGARARRRTLAAALSAWTLVVASAAYTRELRPFAMLAVWASTPVAGLAIYETFDLHGSRGEFRLDEIRPVERPGAPHPDIILVTVDTVRADSTPPYGGSTKMPGLARLARRSVVFDWAFSPGNTTRRSLPTLATGVSARRVHGRVAGWALRLDPRHVTLADRLRAAGYETAGFFCCRSQFDPEHELGVSNGIDHLVIERDGEQLVARTLAWLQQRERDRARRPLFLWVHVFEPHAWDQIYPPGQYGAPIAPRYERLLGDTDAFMRPLLDFASADERADDTVLVYTSDHGEGLGDHGQPAHSTDLYNTQIRVPLLVRAPGVEPGRVDVPVGLADLPPTLMDFAGYLPPGMPAVDGRSLVPILRRETEPRPESGVVYSSMVADRSVPDSLDALIVGRHKLIVGPDDRVQLFDLHTDPAEQHDLSRSQPALLATMKRELRARQAINDIDPF